MKSLTTQLMCVVVLLAAGCNDGDQNDPSDASIPELDAPMVGPPPPAPEPVDCATDPIARFAGTVTTLSDRSAIAGARVCVLQHPEIPCVTTDAEGFYSLECAPVGDAAISFEAAGFAGGVWLWAGVEGPPQDLSISLARDSENSGFLAPTGMVYPDGASSLITLVGLGTVDGVIVTQRTGTGQGAFYSADEGSRIDPDATHLSESELAFFLARPSSGWEEVEVALQPSSGVRCAELGGAWRARDDAANTFRVPLRAGWETVIWVRCE